jgi:hypothetical protein
LTRMDPFDRVVPAREIIRQKEKREDSYAIYRTREMWLSREALARPGPLFRSRTPHPLVFRRRFLGLNGTG